MVQEGTDLREGKSGLLSSLWRTSSKKIDGHSEENRDINKPALGKAATDSSNGGVSPKGG